MSYDWLLKTFSLKSADYSCLENIPVGMSEKITSEASLVKSGFIRGVGGTRGGRGREKLCFSDVSQNQGPGCGL